MQIVYTISTGYSGSTLLSMLMNAHPNVASIGELANSIGTFLKNQDVKAYECSCGDEITQCKFWAQVQKQCREHGVELNLYDFETQFDLGFGHHLNRAVFGVPGNLQSLVSLRDFVLNFLPNYRNAVDGTLDRNLAIVRSILEVTGKQIFFDASKTTEMAAKLSSRTDIQFKLIHLVRDPRGILYSNLKRNDQLTSSFVGSHWLRIHRAALNIKSKLGKNSYLLVKYESLCSNTQDTIYDICKFIGVESLDLVEGAIQKENHLIGNYMRKKQLESIKLDEEWKTNLQPSQVAEIKRITSNISFELGYRI